jgi:hypothetical protein
MGRAPVPTLVAGGDNEGNDTKLGFQAAVKACLATFILMCIYIFIATPAAAQDFRPHGSIKLEYGEEHDKEGDEKTERSTITQDYELQLDGYIWRHEFLTFQSSFGYNDTMDDDSEQGESRDRNIDYYDISASILPDLWMPLVVEAKKNVILLDSDESEDTESEEDTYRLEWRLINQRIPEIDFEWERIEEVTEETGTDLTTSDTQRDTYRFTASDTIFGKAEDERNTFILSGTADVSSNLRIDVTGEYRTNTLESSMVTNSLALREDVDSVVGVSFWDATQPGLNSIDTHIAIPLTPGGALDFSGWTPSGFATTIDDVDNNQITFTVPIPSDVMVVIEYQTQDLSTYFDIYLGDDNADTYSLTVTQVVITEGFDDYLVFAEYVSISGGLVTLDFNPLTDPEPISSLGFPLQDVDVTIRDQLSSDSPARFEFQIRV